VAEKVKVLRILEYIYDDAETAMNDQSHWQVQGIYKPNSRMIIRSSVIPIRFLEDYDFSSVVPTND
jgi:hypothetical protein